MLELIDTDGNIKFMCSILCYINYGEQLYVIYSIKRDSEDDNIFVSKLVNSSDGYSMDSNFSADEKCALDDVVAAILNKDSVDKLSEKGIKFVNDINLSKINKFSVTRCYVTTFKRRLVKECMINYNLINSKKKVSVVREKEVSYFSKNNFPIVLLIVFGIVIILVAIFVIFNFIK